MVRRFSRVIPSDAEAAAAVRAAHAGKGEAVINEAVSKALATRAEVQARRQADYDRRPPARPYTPPED